MEAGTEGGGDLSRRIQAHSAAQHRQEGGEIPRGASRGAGRARRAPVAPQAARERRALTHKFDIAGHEGYITVGMYEDGTPGEIFVSMSKQGSTISGLMDSFR